MPDKPVDTSPWLSHQWVMAGLVAASARFVPIPFVDDIIRARCRRFVVARTLSAHESGLDAGDLQAFYDGNGGCLGGCGGWLFRAPLTLLLFPIRKLVVLFTSIRGVPLEIMRTVLVGRTLERYLSEAEQNPALAERMKIAFAEAFSGMDFRAAQAATRDALSQASGWKSAAIEQAKQLLNRGDPSATTSEVDPEIEAGANRVEQALQRAEVLALFAEFDERFDRAMRRLADDDAASPPVNNS